MGKRFNLKNKLWVIIVSLVVSIILLACCIVNILQLCEVGSFKSYNEPLTILSTVISFIIIILILAMVFGSGYTFTKKGILMNIGLIFYTIKYDDIYKIRANSDKTLAVLYIKTDSKGDVYDEESNIRADILQVYVTSDKIDSFAECIKNANSSIIYEIYNEEPIKKDVDSKNNKENNNK